MYTNYNQFWADYRTVRRYYEEFTENIGWLAAPDPERAWGIYQQARDVEYGILVMGRTCVDEAGRTPDQFGNAITEQEHQALGVITHQDEQAAVLAGRGIAGVVRAVGGMVMHYYGGINSAWRGGLSGYHFLYNDAWLLGGAHAKADFNLASPRREMNLWVGGDNGRLTATGREVVFLNDHGYRVVNAGAGLETFTCAASHWGDEAAAGAATLASCVNAIRGITRRAQILGMCTTY